MVTIVKTDAMSPNYCRSLKFIYFIILTTSLFIVFQFEFGDQSGRSENAVIKTESVDSVKVSTKDKSNANEEDAIYSPEFQPASSQPTPSHQLTQTHQPQGNVVVTEQSGQNNIQQPEHDAENNVQPFQELAHNEVQQTDQNNVQQSLNNVQQPFNNVQQPLNNVQQPLNNVQQPLNNVQQPLNNVQQPLNNVQQPLNNVQQPLNNVQQPLNNVQQPLNNVHQPLNNVQQPLNNVQQPLNNVQQPLNNVQLPLNNVQQPLNNVQHPLNNVQQPLNNVQQPLNNVQQPLNNVHQPLNNVQQPLNNVQQPLNNVQQPLNNVQQPLNNVQQPLNNVQQPLNNLQKPLNNLQQPQNNVALQQPQQNEAVQQPQQNDNQQQSQQPLETRRNVAPTNPPAVCPALPTTTVLSRAKERCGTTRYKNNWYELVTKYRVDSDRLVYDAERKYVWVSVPTIASTNLKKAILQSHNLTDQDSSPNKTNELISACCQLTAQGAVKHYTLQTAYTFTLIRNPWSRLYASFQENIWKNYNTIRKILRTARKWSTADLANSDAVEEAANSITFDEFLTMVADTDTDTDDKHWRPWFLEADPCLILYNYIGYIEDMGTSFSVIKDTIFSDLDIELSSDGTTPEDARNAINAYRKVPQNIIESVYQDFEDDFVIGGYSKDIECIS